ncbi:hypothetical protein RYX36_004637, partial [Vicia faba]
ILESVGEDIKCEQLNFVAEGEITSPHVPDPATPKANVMRMSTDRPSIILFTILSKGIYLQLK